MYLYCRRFWILLDLIQINCHTHHRRFITRRYISPFSKIYNKIKILPKCPAPRLTTPRPCSSPPPAAAPHILPPPHPASSRRGPAPLLALLKYLFYPLFNFDNGMNLISESLTILTLAQLLVVFTFAHIFWRYFVFAGF